MSDAVTMNRNTKTTVHSSASGASARSAFFNFNFKFLNGLQYIGNDKPAHCEMKLHHAECAYSVLFPDWGHGPPTVHRGLHTVLVIRQLRVHAAYGCPPLGSEFELH